MRHYETIYIINPTLSDEGYRDVVTKFSGVVEREKGVTIKVDELGKQKLAYLLKKFDRGSYVLVEYCSDPGMTKEFERELKLDDRILKFQTVKLGDQVDPQDLIVKEVIEEKPSSTEESQEDSNQEGEALQETEKAEEVKDGVR